MADEIRPAAGEQKPEVPPVFDVKAFITERNEKLSGKSSTPAAPAAEKKPEKSAEAKPEGHGQQAKPAAGEGEQPAAPAAGEEHPPRPSRAQRREHNRLLRELGEKDGKIQMLEQLLEKQGGSPAKPAADAKPAAAAGADPKPKLEDFATVEEHQEALARWAVRQEGQQTAAREALRDEIRTAATKADEDRKLYTDWDEAAKEAVEDGPEWSPQEHPQLMLLIARSDVQAAVLYHFSKNPEALERMLALTKNPTEQIRQFHRLEGRMERELDTLKAAQAGSGKEKPPAEAKTAPTAEKPAQGGAAADRDVRKPKPSSEVSAKGGAAAPEEPAIGSAAWMARKNQAQFGR